MSYWGELLEATRLAEKRVVTFEEKNMDRMGVMAYWRTVFAGLNFALGILITLKIFEWV